MTRSSRTAARVATVAELWRYPVKSVQGHRVDTVRVTPTGIVGDRAWAVWDVDNARPLSAKKVPRLLLATSSADGSWVTVEGERLQTGNPAADAVLSRWLGRSVRMVRADQEELGFVDDAPLHLISEGSLAAMKAAHPGGVWVQRRFRPNLVLATAGSAPVEDGWPGQRLRVGEAVVSVTDPTVRCAMTTQEQPGRLPHDPAILRTLAPRELQLGVYAHVLVPGRVREGDPVTMIPPGNRSERTTSGR
jgi:uncharacterized protein